MPLKVERRALTYIRVSSKKQAENFSFESQEKDCIQYAHREGAKPVGCYKDVGSGLSIKHRQGLMAMFRFALDPKNGITDLIFWELDRFSRNIKDFFVITEQLLNAGITLHLSSEEEKYDHRSEDRWHSKLVSAQGESRKISKRTKAGQKTATENGRHIGAVPWGYIICYALDRVDECGWLVIDDVLWPHVLRLWRMAIDGHTPMQIAKEFNMRGIPSPSGKSWTARAVRYILKNEKYAGRVFRGKEPESRLPGPKDDTPMTVRENAHQAAVRLRGFLRSSTADRGKAAQQRVASLPWQREPAERNCEMRGLQNRRAGFTASPRAAYASGVRTRKIQGNPPALTARTSTWSSWRQSSSTGPETSSSPKRHWRAHSKLPKAAAMRTSQNGTAANQTSRQGREAVENQISNLTKIAREGAEAGASRSIVKKPQRPREGRRGTGGRNQPDRG